MKERLIEFINYKGEYITTFEAKCGLSRGIVSHLTNGLRSDILAKIAVAYPDLNIRWLITGEGGMLNPPEIKPDSGRRNSDELQWMLRRVETLEDMVGGLSKRICELIKTSEDDGRR